jgi:hypothetical protein
MNRLIAGARYLWMLFAALHLLAGASSPKPVARMVKVAVWADPDERSPLSASDLTATAAGSALRVVDVKGPGDGLLLIVVLDLAGDFSLAGAAKEALITEIDKLPQCAAIAVMAAQDGSRVLADPGADRAVTVAAIRDQPVSGKAGLLDSVETVTDLADSILAGSLVRVAVLYVTDSDVENYREDFTNPVINSSDTHDLSRRFPEALIQDKIAKLAEVLAKRQAPLFVVHLRYRSDRLGEAYQKGLDQLAEVTGGSATFCRSSEEIAEAIPRVIASVLSSYTVALALPERPPKILQLQLDRAGKESLRYRARLVMKEK